MLMSGRLPQLFLERGGDFHPRNWATAHSLAFWQCLGTVTVPLGVSFSLLIEDQGLTKVHLSAILDPFDSNRGMLCPSVSSVQSLSRFWLFATPWAAARQASLSITNPQACPNSCPLSQWCHPTNSASVIPSPPTFNLSQNQGLFQWVSSWYQVAKILEFQLQHQFYQWIVSTISFSMTIWSLWSPKDSQESSPTLQFKSVNSSVLSLLYGSILTSIHDYRKNHSFD